MPKSLGERKVRLLDIWDAFKKPMGPCIKPKRRHSEGQSRVLVQSSRGSYRVWLAMSLKGLHRETILSGFARVISPGNRPLKVLT